MAGYGQDRYGGNAFGGARVGRINDSGTGITIPGSTSVYYWLTSGGAGAWGQAAYGGARSVNYPSAGLFAVPDADSGTVTIPLWWGYSSAVNVSRVVAATGERTPVRGASPFLTGGVTHHNSSLNPKASVDLVGCTVGLNTTLGRATGLTPRPSPYVSSTFRGTTVAAGNANLQFTGEPVSATSPWTYGFWARTSATATAINVVVTWFDIGGLPVGAVTYPVDTVARTQALNAFSWCRVDVNSVPALAVTGVLSYQATGLPTGGTFDVTGRVAEPTGSFLGSYFDGDYPGGAWNGAAGDSASDLATIFYALDGEAPLDVPVFYELTNPSTPGFKAQTQIITLDSQGNRTWLTHPASPSSPIRVEILGPFGPVTRAIVQGTYYPLDSTDGLPIVKTQSVRRGRTGSIKFLAITHGERDRLLGLFEDGSPVLVRSPDSYGYGDMWLSLGDLVEDQGAYWSESPYRTLTAPYSQVAAPLTANELV